ncbi:MAG: ABC-F family ATPase [Deltaproteobacteria bacterium]|nr:ABC-F family ATPase [Deltaproteobacteria bacterium]
MITAHDLSKNYGGQTLFEEVDLQLNAGNCFGIVGANGSGKSTLLRILAEQETSSGGQVTRVKSARVGMLEQDHFAYEDTPIIEVVMQGNELLWNAIVEKEKLLDQAHEHFDEDRYVELEDIIIRFDGYQLESKAASILEGLNIPTSQHRQPLKILSGGYKLRALLGKALASDPDILFLDEPDNHLDILSITWLEGFLQKFKGLAVVVSHDHSFLDGCCTHIIDVDYQRAILYRGNYSKFVVQKQEERARREIEISRREKEIADLSAFVTRFKAKATKARQANSRAKQMEKMVIEPLPQSSRRDPTFKFKQRRASGRDVLKVRDVTKAYGDNLVLLDLDFTMERGDRLAIIGPNGIGKSTLLKIIMGEVDPDMGTSEWGYEAVPGYFPQDHQEVLKDPEQDITSCLWDVCPAEPMGFVYGKLAEVLFNRDDMNKKCGVLSGGEAARLLLSRIGVEAPTVLVLDEPTNHLDIEGIQALAKGLRAYEGTIIFVSHDRWFVQQVATRIIEITPEGVEDFPGTYEEHLARNASEDHLDSQAVVERAREEKREKKRQKKNEKDRKEKAERQKQRSENESGGGDHSHRKKTNKKKGKGRR